MSTDIATPTAPATAPISAHPSTPVNPTARTRPTSPTKAPTTQRPPASAAPDLSKARSANDGINDALKQGIDKVWRAGAATAAAPATTTPASATSADAAPAAKPADAATPPPVATPEPAVSTSEPSDRYAAIAEPDGISDAGKKGWKALKTQASTDIAAAEKKLADAETQLATLRKATPADIADVTALKAEHQKALDRLAVLDLQSHPDFTRQFTEPKAKALADATEVLAYNGKGAIDQSLLGKSQKDFNAAVADMTKDMNTMDASTVQTAMRSAYKLAGDEKAALVQAGELKAGIDAKSAQQRTQAFEKVYGSLGFEALIAPKEAPAGATPEQKAQVAEFNQSLSQFRSMAEKNAFGRLSVEDQAAVSIKAALYDLRSKHVDPFVEKGYTAVMAERDALIKEVQSLRGLKSPGSFTAPADPGSSEKQDAQYFLKKAFARK